MHNRVLHLPRFVFCLPLLLSACAVTRVAPPPPVTAPAAFKEDTPWQRGTGAAAAVAVPDDWWTLFGDPQLNALEARLIVGNENLKSLAAQLASARAAVEASRSALYPTLSVSAGATRDGNPAQTTGNGGNGGSISNTANSMTLGASAAWEVDLWGRLSQASEGAQASAQASFDDLAAARLSAQSTLAQTYFSLRTSDAQLDLLTRSVAAYQRSLDLTQARYDGGVAARSDVLQAQTQLKSAQAQQADMAAQRATLEHAIAVLLGIPPSALEVAGVAGLPAVPPVPALLPSTLLERRPDIAAAQRRVAAAYAQIGVADASYFPALSLSASAGYRNTSLSNLVSAPNFLWSLGSSLTEAIFDGGQRKLASAQARAAADQATSTYRQSVLTALQEVEDNLVLASRLQEEVAYQADAVAAAQRNLTITNDQYAGGTVSYLNVVTAQTAAFTSESSLLSVQNRQLAATAILLKNIAGRWDTITPGSKG
ncbi:MULTISPECIES: efflux transporter outer membrane subunit [unclassified Janthinobacterium]|uniref:efflux transporter outer membrane subunit n=1 Tax=unclassified Janthinobacterium TaxID=2610881 RepID=UPI00161B6997|nr:MULTISPECIES: efflux transporter outer membrane subunit [unclassified Janthinobacterium]MBB5606339.1 NodT family efflux transporter outer membrane factor (OMF) lipoprotein [Janthinobacterium sp. S3T4]MBB5611789.1 NodT family efflux transporter outer membrane factor (OMF) lipoprotein [Janthinobacterium sp. S3M3]